MAVLADNPIKNHYKGMPCMFGNVVGRIIGESEKGSWGIINGVKVFSIPKFSTPHGTIIEGGRLYFDEITEEGMQRLLNYEKELKSKNEEMYSGRINNYLNEQKTTLL